ncbi:TetR family transcriptional regulator [Mycobacterium florentinum]|uniref:TetR family transcriptional regulator n=1 Tax=Mycobacterium florentinum TaxID=292462 RepID=A0A1X1U3Y9_MYCFL|nr:TetR/AcrR family transcriptional regulator [Mycobacterium florentinum]MCV7411232.1 TetR/AcrR family transcriptional regulator [Mycobacterium florentinum]ORV51388.1 TetR family transcriptional regulator [Mycobacterium florentinum]BBX80582.1 TetR family transcriptional regulator [Mycobacterium florentinum]
MYISVVTTTRRGRPTQAEAKKLQQKLRNAAVATFVKLGYDGASMEAIAKAAGITRRTLYARYPDKRAVFLDVIPWALTRRTEGEATEEFDDGDLRAALVAVGRAGLARAIDPDIVRLKRIAMNESARFPEFAVSAHSMTWSARHRQVMELLRRHQDAGAIEVDDLELAAGHFIAAVEHLPARLADSGIYRSPEEEERHLQHAVDLFLRGILRRG